MKFAMVAAALALMAAACSTAPYAPPPGKPQAQVRLATNTSDLTRYHVVDAASCPDLQPQWLVSLGPRRLREASALKMLGHSAEPESQQAERRVEARRMLNLWVQSSREADAGQRGQSCRGGVRFLPEAGKQYEVNYRLDNTAFTRYCSLSVEELVADSDEGVRRVPVRTRQLVRYMNDFCEPSPRQ